MFIMHSNQVCFSHPSDEFVNILVDMDPNWCYEHYLSHRSLVSADNVRAQLKRVMERNDLEMMSTPFEDPTYYTNIRRALTCGFFMQVAKKAQGAKHYVTVKDQQVVSLHPSTVLETLPEWVIYNEYLSLFINFCRSELIVDLC